MTLTYKYPKKDAILEKLIRLQICIFSMLYKQVTLLHYLLSMFRTYLIC